MNRLHGNTLPEAIGLAVIERQLLDSLSHLWHGPLSPSDLARVEKCLRAFITGQTLVAARFQDAWDGFGIEEVVKGSYELEAPLHDHVLDYEFIAPETTQPFSHLDEREASFLENFVMSSVKKTVFSALPKWISRTGEFMAFVDAWYRGDPLELCEEKAREMFMWEWDEYSNPFDPKDVNHAVFQKGPFDHASYLVGCHRAGGVVYGDSPIAAICGEHVFSRWPEELFRILDEDAKEAARQLRGPGIAFLLPPLTGIVMTRAQHRHRIPEVIREMREEYAKARKELWTLLEEMWSAESFGKQLKYLSMLESASRSIFAAAFPEKLDVLSIGLSLAPLTPSALGSAAKMLLDRDKPRSRVAAVSFAEKLVKDLRKQFANSRSILRRHLTDAELRDFGF